MKQKMTLLSLALLLVSANSLFSNAYRSESAPCDKERMCAKNPLYCDGFNIQFHGGVSPIIWANRGCMSFLSTGTTVSCASAVSCPSIASCPSINCSPDCNTTCDTSCVSPLSGNSFSCASDCATTAISRIQIPKFNKLFDTPWTIGATLGYAITQHQEVFFEFNYTQAANKREYFATNVTNAAAVPVLLHTNLVAKYKNASAYFGYRYNFDRMRCFPRDFLGDMAWFVSLKAGMLHHFGVRGYVESSFSTIVDGSTTPFFDIFKSNTTFSGAGEVGVDICLNCDWSLMVAAEVAANWGPTCHNVVTSVTELSSVSVNTAKVGAEILFPVTFGLRYKF